jgi:MSHA biogenesis protein MshP
MTCRRPQRGMSMVVAIFLIVVVASLAAFAVSAGTARANTVNLQLQADRALAAARAGSEWGAYRTLVQNWNCAAPATINFNQAALRGFRVTVSCTRTNHTEGPTTYAVFDVVSFAQWGNFGADDYASRRITARYSNAP